MNTISSDGTPERIETETTEPDQAPPPRPSLAAEMRERAWRVALVMVPIWALALVLLQALARAGGH